MASTEWDLVDALTLGLTQEVSKPDAKQRIKALLPAINALRADFVTQKNAGSQTDIPRLTTAARALWDEIELITGTGPQRPWSQRFLEHFSTGGVIGIIILLVAFGGVAYFMGAYIWKVDITELRTIEGARPILTITAVLATITFGGGLVFAALFSNEGAFENRFRMAREIFLVFSGVFATVVGFHFGKPGPVKSEQSVNAEQSKQTPKTPIAEISALEKDGKLTLAVKGGTPPFKATITLDSATLTADGQSPLSIDLKEIDTSKEFGKISVKVIDSADSSKEIIADKVKLKDWASNGRQTPNPVKQAEPAASKIL